MQHKGKKTSPPTSKTRQNLKGADCLLPAVITKDTWNAEIQIHPDHAAKGLVFFIVSILHECMHTGGQQVFSIWINGQLDTLDLHLRACRASLLPQDLCCLVGALRGWPKVCHCHESFSEQKEKGKRGRNVTKIQIHTKKGGRHLRTSDCKERKGASRMVNLVFLFWSMSAYLDLLQ